MVRCVGNLNQTPDSDEALSVLIHVVAIPVRYSIRIILRDLSTLQSLQRYFGEWKCRCEAAARGTA